MTPVDSGPRRGLDRGVRWSLGLLLAFFPLMLLFLAVIGVVASVMGVELGGDENLSAQRWLNTLYVVMALCPLVASIVIAWRTWSRRHDRAALVIAALGVVTLAAFLVFPAVAGLL